MSRTFGRPFQPVFLSVLVLGVGCGPFGYLKKTAKEANRAVADAEAVGAEQYAPYEYWGAVTYLEQSKVMMAYSEYERSFDYGERAKDLAVEAKKKTQMREAGKDVVTDPKNAPEGAAGPEGEVPEASSPGPQPEPSPSGAQGAGASGSVGGSVGGQAGAEGQAKSSPGGDL